MSTRKCDRCDEICYGCDNDDDPHYCPSCKEKKDMSNITETISTEATKPSEHTPKPGEIFYAREWLRHPLGNYHEAAALCKVGEDGIGYSYIYLGDPPPRYNTTGGGYSVPMPEADQEAWRKKRLDICYVSTVNMVA